MNKNQIINTLSYENYCVKLKANQLLQMVTDMQEELNKLRIANSRNIYDCSRTLFSMDDTNIDNLRAVIQEQYAEIEMLRSHGQEIESFKNKNIENEQKIDGFSREIERLNHALSQKQGEFIHFQNIVSQKEEEFGRFTNEISSEFSNSHTTKPWTLESEFL